MSKKRKQIRNLAAGLLLNSTSVGPNVFPTRIVNVKSKNLPCINIYASEEIITSDINAPVQNRRVMSLVCEIIIAGLDDPALDDMSDDIGYEIEQIFAKQDADINSELGCLIESMRVSSLTQGYENLGELSTLNCKLVFTVEYYEYAIDQSLPDENQSELKKIAVDWDVGTASDPDPEAQDIITIGS